MSARYSIRCNGCSRDYPGTSDRSLRDIRDTARTYGWTHPAAGSGYCQLCSEARAKRAKEENPNGYH